MGHLIVWICGLISLVCLIIVIVKMFQAGQTMLGLLCAVLTLFGIGALVTYIAGWVEVNQLRVANVMWTWTIAIVLMVLLGRSMILV